MQYQDFLNLNKKTEEKIKLGRLIFRKTVLTLLERTIGLQFLPSFG